MARPFTSFNEALKALPRFIGGIDLVGQHKTIADLAFRVQHEIDLFREGDENEIQHDRRNVTSIRYRKCKDYLARCAA